MDVVRSVFAFVDPKITLTVYKEDGDGVIKGDVIAEIAGLARSILTGERLAPNLYSICRALPPASTKQ